MRIFSQKSGMRLNVVETKIKGKKIKKKIDFGVSIIKIIEK
jgi:hypothetical protein